MNYIYVFSKLRRNGYKTAGPSLDVSADIIELCSKSLTLGRMSKLFCSRLLAIFCRGNDGGWCQNRSACVPVCRKSNVSSVSFCSHVISQSGSM